MLSRPRPGDTVLYEGDTRVIEHFEDKAAINVITGCTAHPEEDCAHAMRLGLKICKDARDGCLKILQYE